MSQLEPGAQAALAAIAGAGERGIDAPTLAERLGVHPLEGRRLIEALIDAYLVVQNESGTHRVESLIRNAVLRGGEYRLSDVSGA